MIKVENLSKSFGKKEVYKEVNLEFELGKCYAIVGVSGSGKTTLLNAIARLEKQSSGVISFNGEDIWKMKEQKYFKEYLGYIFQSYALIDDKTVAYNLKIVNKDKNKQIEVLEKVGLSEEFLDSKIYELSGGQSQRVAIARMLLKNPKVILADEPTGALDEQTSEQVGNLLKTLVKEDTVLIIATHDLELAKQMDKTIYVEDFK